MIEGHWQGSVNIRGMRIKNVLGNTLDHLGEAVVSGRYGADGALPPEPLLCASLGVSRSVVREAVKSLVAKGLLSTGPKVGTRVQPADQWNWFDPDVVAWHSRSGLSREFVRDLHELRRVVEPAAVALAAQRATAADLERLEQAFAGMSEAIRGGGDYVRHDLAFHQGLLAASHNRMLIHMSKALAALLRTSFELSTARPDSAAKSLPNHRAILDAVIARNAPRAHKAALVLIDNAGRDIDTVLASRRKLPSLAAPPTRLAVPAARAARVARG
jgi:DNA-binding FadR family transcriptional regulator